MIARTVQIANIVFRCPATGFEVQYELDDDSDIPENEYEAVRCVACTALHLINRRTGKVMGQGSE
jgi:hypothetical protein